LSETRWSQTYANANDPTIADAMYVVDILKLQRKELIHMRGKY
jgi:hypothetical protein